VLSGRGPKEGSVGARLSQNFQSSAAAPRASLVLARREHDLKRLDQNEHVRNVPKNVRHF